VIISLESDDAREEMVKEYHLPVEVSVSTQLKI